MIFCPLRFRRNLSGLSGSFSIFSFTPSAVNFCLCSGEKKENVFAVRFLLSSSALMELKVSPIFLQKSAILNCSFIIGNKLYMRFSSSYALYGSYSCLALSSLVSMVVNSSCLSRTCLSISRNLSLASSLRSYKSLVLS